MNATTSHAIDEITPFALDTERVIVVHASVRQAGKAMLASAVLTQVLVLNMDWSALDV